MRLRRLLAMTLATTLLASGIAAAQETGDSPPDEPPAGTPLAGVTLSCSLAAPSWVAGCWVELPIAVLGPVELAIGVDVQGDLAALTAGDLAGSHVAPYGILAYYGEDTTIWAELRLPRLGNVPVLGASDVLRVGFTATFP